MHSCICGSCGSDWSMRYADTHKGASVSAARIYRLLLSGVRWHESHICAAAWTSDKVVLYSIRLCRIQPFLEAGLCCHRHCSG